MGDHRDSTIVAVGEAQIHQSNFEEVLTHDDDSFSLMFENMDSKFQDLNGFHSSSLKLLTSRTKFPELDASSSRRMRVRENVSFSQNIDSNDFDDLSLRIETSNFRDDYVEHCDLKS